MRFGIRLHLIVRETKDAAWRAAEDLIRYADDSAIAAAQKALSQHDSVGQQRMRRLHAGNREKLEFSPNLWAGVGLLRGGAGTALVGDPAIVAERMQEYADLGIETFICSGYPHLEEAYRVAELLFPLLPLSHAGQWTERSGRGSAAKSSAIGITHRRRSAGRGGERGVNQVNHATIRRETSVAALGALAAAGAAARWLAGRLPDRLDFRALIYRPPWRCCAWLAGN